VWKSKIIPFKNKTCFTWTQYTYPTTNLTLFRFLSITSTSIILFALTCIYLSDVNLNTYARCNICPCEKSLAVHLINNFKILLLALYFLYKMIHQLCNFIVVLSFYLFCYLFKIPLYYKYSLTFNFQIFTIYFVGYSFRF